MAARAGSRPWWEAFTTNVKNQGSLVIDMLKQLVHREESESRDEEKLKEVILEMKEQSNKRFAGWFRSELAKECWREHLHGASIPFETFHVEPPAADFSSSSSSSAAADHRGGSVLPGDLEVMHAESTARLEAWGFEVLEKMRREQLVESVSGFQDYFDTAPSTGTNDDASSVDHCVGPILMALQSNLSSPHAASFLDADHRQAASSSSSRVAAATVDSYASTSFPDAHQRDPAATIAADHSEATASSSRIASASASASACHSDPAATIAADHSEATASSSRIASASACHSDPASASLDQHYVHRHRDVGFHWGPRCGTDRFDSHLT
uniref:Uncharacterized protein n=1 Tax=Oryza sativa subsp. japonica TaxID=39947 RepID=Q2QYP5_ORYSJ|nr:hypothetical protein LOC_Os12g01990 [Oryza sativa Japonica Group]